MNADSWRGRAGVGDTAWNAFHPKASSSSLVAPLISSCCPVVSPRTYCCSTRHISTVKLKTQLPGDTQDEGAGSGTVSNNSLRSKMAANVEDPPSHSPLRIMLIATASNIAATMFATSCQYEHRGSNKMVKIKSNSQPSISAIPSRSFVRASSSKQK